MTKRDEELQNILDIMADFRKRYHIRNINMAILGGGEGYAYGYDGREKVEVHKNYDIEGGIKDV